MPGLTPYRSRLAGAALAAGVKTWRSKSNSQLAEFLAKEGKLMDFWRAFPAYFNEGQFRRLVLKRKGR